MNEPTLLQPDDLERQLAGLPEWEADADVSAIFRSWHFRDFRQSMAFVNAVAKLAEERAHHPDISVSYDTVILSLSTHSVGGLTAKDFDLAVEISRLPEASGGVRKQEDFLAG